MEIASISIPDHILLRIDRGAAGRIARDLGVHPTMVSKVVHGKKTSQRVRTAILEYLVTRRDDLVAAAFLIEHGARR